ncbi:MAG: RluA family pseudouridine synthase, partial [Alphaproteobacteria bacterium]|nr:RluA family pseudouridine synthase [Alphaproteobacteria bacterium]
MSVEFKVVQETEKDIRLDRWFKRHYPDVPHGMLEKLLRKKNIRVDNKKAVANTRLNPGAVIRIPPLTVAKETKQTVSLSKKDVSLMQGMVLYKDKDIIVLNK